MACNTGRKVFSRNYLFASFFGAAMVAGAFAYYNYKFSQFKFIDFEQYVFYEKKDIFTPKEDKYMVLVYSSNMADVKEILKNIKSDHKILAIDFYQRRFESENGIIYITSGTNTLIAFLQRFDIFTVPSIFVIKKEKNNLYKQHSQIKALE